MGERGEEAKQKQVLDDEAKYLFTVGENKFVLNGVVGATVVRMMYWIVLYVGQ